MFVKFVKLTFGAGSILKNKPTDYFEFIPLNPISPRQITGEGSDIRKLGIGFISLRIEE